MAELSAENKTALTTAYNTWLNSEGGVAAVNGLQPNTTGPARAAALMTPFLAWLRADTTEATQAARTLVGNNDNPPPDSEQARARAHLNEHAAGALPGNIAGRNMWTMILGGAGLVIGNFLNLGWLGNILLPLLGILVGGAIDGGHSLVGGAIDSMTGGALSGLRGRVVGGPLIATEIAADAIKTGETHKYRVHAIEGDQVPAGTNATRRIDIAIGGGRTMRVYGAGDDTHFNATHTQIVNSRNPDAAGASTPVTPLSPADRETLSGLAITGTGTARDVTLTEAQGTALRDAGNNMLRTFRTQGTGAVALALRAGPAVIADGNPDRTLTLISDGNANRVLTNAGQLTIPRNSGIAGLPAEGGTYTVIAHGTVEVTGENATLTFNTLELVNSTTGVSTQVRIDADDMTWNNGGDGHTVTTTAGPPPVRTIRSHGHQSHMNDGGMLQEFQNALQRTTSTPPPQRDLQALIDRGPTNNDTQTFEVGRVSVDPTLPNLGPIGPGGHSFT